MIARLSSFSDQFKPGLVEKGKALFDEGKVRSLKKGELNWDADVLDTKTYKVTLLVDDGMVTNIFCPCSAAICRHVIAVMFAVQKRLKIAPEPFDPAVLEPPPLASHTLLGRRLNDIVYVSRAPGTKDGELEELGENLTLKEPDVQKLRAIVAKGKMYPHEKSRYPILTGAKRLLGAAILKFEKKDYEYVLNIARAVLTEICMGEMYGNSANECACAAVELYNTLCTDPDVPAEMRRKTFNKLVFACKSDIYSHYHDELLSVLHNPQLDKEMKDIGEKELQARPDAPADYRARRIDEAFAKQDYETVKQLARDGITHDDWRIRPIWNEWLLKIALLENDFRFLRAWYKNKYFKEGYDESCYEACRAQYASEEWWLKELTDWISQFNLSNYSSANDFIAVAKIYIREKMIDKLLALVQSHYSFELAQFAEPHLLPGHADELMAAYKELFIRMAQSTQRQPAIDLRNMLKMVRRSAKGKKLVKELVPYLLDLHPTWKVFREELSQLQ